MQLHNKIDLLLSLEKDQALENLKINNEYIWPYLKNKILGEILIDENEGRRNINYFLPSRDIIVKEKQAININKHYDAVIFDFVRQEYNSNDDVYDSRNENLITKLKNEGISFVEIISFIEGSIIKDINQDNVYLMDDIYTLKNKVNFELKSKNYKNKEINTLISKTFEINFDIKKYEKELLINVELFHKYLKEVLIKISPKVIFVNANVVRPFILIVAKELGIPVYDVQYAAILPYHIGYYHRNKDYKFSPDGLLVWGEYWKNSSFLSTTVKDIQIIGQDKNKEMIVDIERKSNSILIVSQDLFSKRFLNEAIDFAKNFPEYTVYYKKHPLEKIPESIMNNTLTNFIFVSEPINKLNYIYDFIVGINSTAIFELANIGNKVILLDDIMTEYMKDLISQKKALVVSSLVKDFLKIKEYDYYNVNEFFTYEEKVNWDALLKKEDKITSTSNNEFISFYEKQLSIYNKNNFELTVYNSNNITNDLNDKMLTVVINVLQVDKINRVVKQLKEQKLSRCIDILICTNSVKSEELTSLSQENVNIISNDDSGININVLTKQMLELIKTQYVYFIDTNSSIYSNSVDVALYQLIKTRPEYLKMGVIINENNFEYSQPIKALNNKEASVKASFMSSMLLANHYYKVELLKSVLDHKKHINLNDMSSQLSIYMQAQNSLHVPYYSVVYKNEVDIKQEIVNWIDVKEFIKKINLSPDEKMFFDKYIMEKVIKNDKYLEFLLKNHENNPYLTKFIDSKTPLNDIVNILNENKLFIDDIEVINEHIVFNAYPKNIFCELLYKIEGTGIEVDYKNKKIKLNIKENIQTQIIVSAIDDQILKTKPFESFEILSDNALIEVKYFEEKIKLNIKQMTKPGFNLIKYTKINDQYKIKLVFSGNKKEFNNNEYYIGKKRLKYTDTVFIGKSENYKLEIKNKNNDIIYVARNKDNSNQINKDFQVLNDEGKIKFIYKKQAIKQVAKKVINKVDKKKRIINFLKKQR